VLGLEIERGGICLRPCCWEMHQPMHAVFGTGFGDPLGYLDIDELEIFPSFDLVART
jgi:hypothetical protein